MLMATDEIFDYCLSKTGSYMPYFNTIILNGIVPDDELKTMTDHSCSVVVGKLPKYI